MRFTPKTEEEINSFNLMQEGIYDFEVISAKDKISRNGNDMIEVQLKVWDKEGKEHLIYDYLLEAMAFKLRHFAESTGLLDKYNAGTIECNDCLHRMGKVEIIVQGGQPKETGGFYSDKNAVKDYIKLSGTIEAPKDTGFINDDINF